MKKHDTDPPTLQNGRADHLVAFFLVTYAVSWSCFAIIAVDPLRMAAGARSVLLFFAISAPALVALCFATYSDGRAGTLALLRQITLWRVGFRWYLFAISYMAAVKLLVAAIYRFGTGVPPRFGSEPWFILAIAAIISTPVQAGEEIGWRGYALPRLARKIGYAWGSVVLGLIWAGWHLPIFFIQGADKYGQSFWTYVLQVTALSVAIAWLYVYTHGSLLLCMLMHSAVNQSAGIVSSITASKTNPFTSLGSTVGWLTAAVLWIGGICFILDMLRGPNEVMPRHE